MNIIILLEHYIENNLFIYLEDKELLYYLIDFLQIEEDDKLFIFYNKNLDNNNLNNQIKERYPNIILIDFKDNIKNECELLCNCIKEIIKKHNCYSKTILFNTNTFYTSNIINKYKKTDNNVIFYRTNFTPKPLFSYVKLDNIKNIVDIYNYLPENPRIYADSNAYGFDDINKLYYYAKYVLENENEFNILQIIRTMIQKNEIFRGIELKRGDVHTHIVLSNTLF